MLERINSLSLDVATGAMASAYFFAIIFQTPISLFSILALGCTVWMIYTADHLIDAKKSKSKAATERHRFHQDHFKSLTGIVMIIFAVDMGLITQLENNLLYAGCALGVVVGLYILFNRALKTFKEIVAAVLYTGGVLLPSLALIDEPITLSQRLIVIQFFGTALINLLLFSLMEKQADEKDLQVSFVTIRGETQTGFLLQMLLVVAVGLLLAQLQIKTYANGAVILFAMNVILALLFIFRQSTMVKNHYRLIGDGIFLLPVIVAFI